MIYTAIDTFYLTEEQLTNSPSRKDGISEEEEYNLRLFGSELIQESGILLRMPQAVMATGQVLFHRFYCKRSFAMFNVKRVSAACTWLAGKLEESPRKIKDVLNVFCRMEQRREGLPYELLESGTKKFEDLKTDLIRTERHLLKEMGFICHVEHPHKFILDYLRLLDAKQLGQAAWNLANDSLRTTLCVRFKGEVVACGVIYAAARRCQVPLPENPPWWLVFNAKKEDIDEVCRVLAKLYRQKKATYVEVSKNMKSFVLSSKAWEPPPTPKQLAVALKGPPNGVRVDVETAAPIMRVNGESFDDGKGGVEPVEQGDGMLESEKAESPQSNGIALKLHVVVQKGKAKERSKGEEREKSSRERVSDRERDRKDSREGVDRARERNDRVREKGRDREKEREREKLKDRKEGSGRLSERDNRERERSKVGSYLPAKARSHSTGRERDSHRSSHAVSQDKDRSHRYRPY
eukprot:TRINITY_DN17279_c0_g2_i1.p1 TRINITY_DN17279_c0_g2~~TRINITY_DN17279_c0_g2_i1.p1  ORF type:complete len:464 (+),score=119.44 TRINITY_DN17279_c0_g2_i1:181-1572(+)